MTTPRENGELAETTSAGRTEAARTARETRWERCAPRSPRRSSARRPWSPGW
ncbi:hypothetical protein ACFQX6_32770 [Streptosporangium lutulentum]